MLQVRREEEQRETCRDQECIYRDIYILCIYIYIYILYFGE